MEAAFVDIGLERNGFLHVDEIVLPGGQAVPKRGRGRGRRIDELIKPGQEIIVQVVKDPLKTKGARLSMQLSIAGRYLVYMPQGGGIGVSKRLPDNERQRLRKLIEKVDIGEGGVIVRTAAQGAKQEDFVREIAYLHRLNEVVTERAEKSGAGEMVFQEADLSIRVVRDVLVEEFEGAIIDDEKQYDRVTKFLQRTAPELADRVELYKGKEPLLEKWGVEEAFASVLSRRVDLPSGGYLMIDYAEALTVIDINTGSFTGKGRGRLEDTITKVNVEAAEEVVRQLRMRDIGGIIVIDFIDMARARNRDMVLKTLRTALDEDRTKTYVVEVSPLGLVEMTRQNVTDGVREILTKTLSDLRRRGRSGLRGDDGDLDRPQAPGGGRAASEARCLPHPGQPPGGGRALASRLGAHGPRGGDRQALPLRGWRGAAARHLPRRRDRHTGGDRGARAALPVGNEVLVTIEEPHMYNVDDAVARVDSYIVSVTGGGPHVGEQRMVRIESVGRSSATASLLDSEGNVVLGLQWRQRREGRILGLRRAPASRKQGRKATLTRRR